MTTTDLDNSFKGIPLPTTANFASWQSKTRLLLANAGVWNLVMPINPLTNRRPDRPGYYNAAAPTAGEREAVYRYDDALGKAVAAIANAAGDNYLDMAMPYIDRNDPGGLWDELETRLAVKSGASRFNALNGFFGTLLKAGELYSDLGGRISSARSRVQALLPTGFTVMQLLDELEAFQFLRAFPEDSVTRNTIIAQGNLDPTHVKSMVELLITAPASATPDRANLATYPSTSGASSTVECGFCDTKGNHREDKCYAKADYKRLYLADAKLHQRRKPDGSTYPFVKAIKQNSWKDRKSKKESANTADASYETAGIASAFTSFADPNADFWTPDSGASSHMTPRSDWIQSLRPDRRPIKVADGRWIHSAGIGSVVLYPTPRGNAFRLDDVLLVPDLNANLISTNRLSRLGLTIVTKGYHTKFLRDKTFLFQATIQDNNLAYLDVTTQHLETAAHAFSHALPATPQLWHQRMAHAGVDLMKKLRSSNAVKGFKVIKGPEVDPTCEPCIEGKMHRAPHTSTAERASKPLERVSTDVHGPLPTRSRAGNQYWIVFIDQYSGLAAVYFMREKGEATQKFRLYKAWAENQLSTTIKKLRDDKGGEYNSHELLNFTLNAGIDRERTIRNTPQQNGQAERFNLTLEEGITSMLSQAQLPPSMWQDAALTFIHVHNRKPSMSRDGKSPYELWHGHVPSVGHFRVWGCLAYVHLQRDQRVQLASHALKCVFIRYSHEAKGWVFWDTERRREIVSDSAVFDEYSFPGTLTGAIHRRIVEVPPLGVPDMVDDDPAPAQQRPPTPPAPVPPAPTSPAPHNNGGGSSHSSRQSSPSNEPPPPPRITIRIPGALERAQIRERAEREINTPIPRELRGLMDRTHFGSRHDDSELPARRGNRAPPPGSSLNVESGDIDVGFGRFNDGERVNTMMEEFASVAKVTPPDMPEIEMANYVDMPDPSWFTKPLPPTLDHHPLIPLLNAIDYALSISTSIEPKLLKEALLLPDAERYIEAAILEIQAHLHNKTWILCRLPAGKKAIGSRWVFKIKRNIDGSIERYKGRIVAKGYAQREGIDYTDTFAPTARFAALRAVIALAAIEDLELESIDISTAFLNGEIDSEIYMEIPEGVDTPEDDGGHKWVVRLLKGLYGIKQGPRIWARKLHKELDSMGFRRLECDHSVFIYQRDSIRIIVPVHVDDLLLASNDKQALVLFKEELGKRFKIRDLGPVSQILGIQLDRDRPNRTISLWQPRYIDEMIQEIIGDTPFNGTHVPMDDLKVMVAGPATREESEMMEKIDYRALVGKLLYLSIATRPDISFAVGVLCRYNDSPRIQHWNAAKRVLRYVKQTRNLKLTYSPSSPDVPFVVYSDADLGGDPSTARSTAGYVTKIGTGAVSWGSRLQKHTSLSSTEAEYTTASAAGTELMWMRYFFEECGYQFDAPSTLFVDNASAIQVAKNPEHQSTMKHVHREYHWIRENVENKLIHVAHVPGADNIADIFTKPLKRANFTRLRELLGLLP